MVFDVNTPSPDDGHEAIRQAVVGAIEELGTANAGVGDAYWLVDMLFSMVDGLYVQLDLLTARVDALSPALVLDEDGNDVA